MDAVLMRISSGTIEVVLLIMPWTRDDEYVSQDTKHTPCDLNTMMT